jgi:hypothetical protein
VKNLHRAAEELRTRRDAWEAKQAAAAALATADDSSMDS